MISLSYTSVISDDTVIVTVTSHIMYGRMMLYNV